MEVIQCLEDFGGPGDPIEFRHTHVIYRQDGQVYRGISKNRHASKTDIKISDLRSTSLIPTDAFCPAFEDSFTRADPSQNANWYIKRPSLSNYSHDYPDYITNQVLEKYGQTLMERVNPGKHSKRTFSLENEDRVPVLTEVINNSIRNIELGIRHLHSLGIIHNDIDPANIMFDGSSCNGDIPLIVDFDSCRPEGHDLSMVKRTYEWTDESVKEAIPQNDFSALQEIRAWLTGDIDAFKF